MADDIAQKITALPELTVVDVADLLAIVDDPDGSPITKKITVANLLVGSVTKVGTPVDNEVAVWTGDGTIEGDANFIWDAVNSKLTLAGAVINLELDDDGELDFYSPGRVEGTRLFQTAANFEIRGVAADDFIIAGFTNLLAGTVDADFDALTATSYGGILEADLLDKNANESIVGIYTFEANPIITATAGVIVQSVFPTYQFRETDAAADNGNWWFIVNGEQFELQLLNDIFTVANTVFKVPRTGAVPDYFGFMEGIPVRIFDSTDTDFREDKHDGTDFLTDFVNTDDWLITGLTGEVTIDAVALALDNQGELDVYSPSRAEGTRLFQTDANFEIRGVAADDFLITGFTKVDVTGIVGVSKYYHSRTATDAQLNQDTDPVNTDAGKIQGAMVYNTTQDVPVWAVGNAGTDVWVDGAGTTVNTPV